MIKVEILKNSMKSKDYNKMLDRVTDEFLHTAGVYIEGEVVNNITRSGIIDTGRLKGSITWQTNRTGSIQSGQATAKDVIERPSDDNVVDIGTNVEYAGYHEYGRGPFAVNSPVFIKGVGWRYIGMHPGIKARPYIRPAARRSRKPVVNKLVQLIRKGLKRGR